MLARIPTVLLTLSRFFAIVCLLSTARAAIARTPADEPVNGVWVVAHRGFKAIAPENTIAAFEAAAKVGANYMELDVRPTADGKLVLMHDSKVERTTNGKGTVSSFSFEAIRRLDAGQGQKIPTLQEALLWAKKAGVRIDIDHKDGPVEDVARVVSETGMVDGVVIEGPRDRLLQFSHLLPGVDTMPHVTSVADIREACAALKTTVIRLSLEQLADPEAVGAVRGCGARVSVTILGANDTEEGIRRVIRLGAQLIETDHPDVVARVRQTEKYVPAKTAPGSEPR
jgi:glycerophosphoryl diester phosphodiesterase